MTARTVLFAITQLDISHTTHIIQNLFDRILVLNILKVR